MSRPLAAGVVLAGGRSSRMGSDKAGLEWHGSTLLRHVAGILSRAVAGPVLVVRAPGQPLPALPAGVGVRDDPQRDQGPLQGLAAGLAAVGEQAETAFVCATDLPFLHIAFIHRVLAGFEEADPQHPVEVVLPAARGFRQPLAAGYRTRLAGRIQGLLTEGVREPTGLLGSSRMRVLAEEDLLADPALAAVDPDLDSLVNLNTPEDYAAARARPAPTVTIRGPAGMGRQLRAATLAAAVAAAGLPPAVGGTARVAGGPARGDALLPLVAGDQVVLE